MKSIEEFAIAFVIGSPDFITVPTILYSFLGYSFIRPNAARCIDYFVGTKHYFDDDYRKIVERELSLSIHRKSIIFTRSILCKKYP